jgi:hypothetical protein
MENSILEYFKLLLDLGIALRVLSDGIKTRSQKKIEKQLQGIIIDLKKILDEAERIIILTQAIDEKVKEYGESNFIKILQGSFEIQIQKLSVIVKKISDSKFIKEIDDKLAIRLKSLVRFQMDNIGSVLIMLLYGKFIVENNQIYLIFGKDKHLVFSKLDEQKEILSQIKECSQSLASHIK